MTFNKEWFAKHNHPFLGKKHTTETKSKISNSKKGNIPWNKGVTSSLDRRIKVSPLSDIKAKKYGMRQADWIKFSIQLRKKAMMCKICHIQTDYQKLDLHHIVSYAISKDNSERNLIVVCKSCHSKIHYYSAGSLWRRNNG